VIAKSGKEGKEGAALAALFFIAKPREKIAGG
jgi:hypothetical protein